MICPDPEAAEQLGQTLAGFDKAVELGRVVNEYPATVDLLRILRAHAPDVLFLSFENLALATATVRFLESQSAGVQIIAMNRTCEATHLRESMRAGIREFLTSPFEADVVSEALKN